MSDSDSDYDVEFYIKPSVTRHTYSKTDDNYLSEDGDSSHSKKSDASENEEDVEEQPEVETQHKLPISDKSLSSKSEKIESEKEPMRTNNRFILYVSNLPPETSKQMLETMFFEAGKVKSVRIPKKRLGNFAFVEMMDNEGFKNALKFNGKEMGEKKIKVYQGSKSKKHVSNTSKIQKRKKYEIVQNKIKRRVTTATTF